VCVWVTRWALFITRNAESAGVCVCLFVVYACVCRRLLYAAVDVGVCVHVSDTCACGSHDGRWSCLATPAKRKVPSASDKLIPEEL
jgi:hypothetical protein